MVINVSRLTPILLFCLANIMTLPTTATAQGSNVECKKAVANAKSRLQKIPNVLIEEVFTKNLNELYSDFPQRRPIVYIFYLTGTKRNGRTIETGIKKVENSTQFMKNISQDIISKCGSVGAVTFSSTLHPTCGKMFGLMRDGEVQIFANYVDDPNRDLKWGETFCW